MDIIRKTIFGGLTTLGLIVMWSVTSSAPMEAKGCINGATIGGVVGHLAGHASAEAATGCIVDHHEAANTT